MLIRIKLESKPPIVIVLIMLWGIVASFESYQSLANELDA